MSSQYSKVGVYKRRRLLLYPELASMVSCNGMSAVLNMEKWDYSILENQKILCSTQLASIMSLVILFETGCICYH